MCAGYKSTGSHSLDIIQPACYPTAIAAGHDPADIHLLYTQPVIVLLGTAESAVYFAAVCIIYADV